MKCTKTFLVVGFNKKGGSGAPLVLQPALSDRGLKGFNKSANRGEKVARLATCGRLNPPEDRVDLCSSVDH